MRLYITAVFIFFTLFAELFAGVHFVSKTGSSSPPYSSWATAADSIQKAVNICNSGDTVYVGNGVYKENVVLRKGISFFGSGIDSCIIDTRTIFTETGFYAVKFEDSCVVKNFNIIVANNRTGFGISNGLDTINYSTIENNKISEAVYGISGSEANILISKNIIQNCEVGISLIAFNTNPKQLITNNIINVPKIGTGIIARIGNEPTIKNNIIMMNGYSTDNGIVIFWDQSAKIFNNIIIGGGGSEGIVGREKTSIINNNLIYGNFSWSAISHYGNYPVKNNIIVNSSVGFRGNTDYDSLLNYNNLWNVKFPYQDVIPNTSNTYKYPMFVNEDSLDFHLQMFSPMIDAGDPDIKDVDGSRSDIGPYGGPYGESYTYKDLAPRTPRNVTGSVDENMFTLKWQKNTEADFAFYRIYRDTIPSFIPDSSKRFAVVYDTSYTHAVKQLKNYYYKISATDNQGNESPKSEEVQIITGVNDKIKVMQPDYLLYQNYPNPFNPTTRIGYKMAKPGYVKISVYDIKGALVSVLENKYRNAGYYEVEFTGSRKSTTDLIEKIASGIYLYQIEIRNENNIPVFNDVRKMILVK